MKIVFIGNCQTLSLCYFFQLLGHSSYWLIYGDEFFQHLTYWTVKIQNKITDWPTSLEHLQTCDVIVYQEISTAKSSFCNTETLSRLKGESCRLIKLPSIWLEYEDYENSLAELERRERLNNVDIQVSKLFSPENRLMLTHDHPKTSIFLEIVKQLCFMLNVPYFTSAEIVAFLEYENYMGLP